jgi:HD-GYP domain-containing protein (c-di-GMP phosphodiesterase class II)
MTDDSLMQRGHNGAALLNTINSLTQNVKMHSDNNDLLLQSAQKFIRLMNLLVQNQSLVSLQHAHGIFYFQQERLTIRPSNARLFNRMLRFFENRAIYGLHFGPEVRNTQPLQIIAFFRMIEQSIGQEGPADWLALQCTRNKLDWVVSIDSSPPANLYDPSLPPDAFSQEDELAASKVQVRKSYAHALSSVKEVARKLTSKQSTGMRTSVRLVQKMVDIISEDETLFLGISTIRIYDDYTYVHSLNVAILSMCLGKQIGLTHNALERLGLCGLFHDLGKVAIPKSVLNKKDALSHEEFALIKTHSMHSARLIMKLQAQRDRKVKILVPPFEHHMGYDHSGYPKVSTGKGISLFGRILTIADVYDAITSPRVYRRTIMSPDRALAHMLGQSGTQFDPVLLKVFINMLGAYPVGTLLQLESGDLAIVIKPPESDDRTRPIVQLLIADTQPRYKKGAVVDLGERDPSTGKPRHVITRSMHPAVKGIDAADFLLH